MEVRAIKHAAKLSEWGERIAACRTSGRPVRTWCEENGINVKRYYRWERLYMAQAEARTAAAQAGSGAAAAKSEARMLAGAAEAAAEPSRGMLVKIEPEHLRGQTLGVMAVDAGVGTTMQPRAYSGVAGCLADNAGVGVITLRHGGTSVELPAGTSTAQIAELIKALC